MGRRATVTSRESDPIWIRIICGLERPVWGADNPGSFSPEAEIPCDGARSRRRSRRDAPCLTLMQSTRRVTLMDLRQDEKAREIALRAWKVPECLHVPIAAVDEAAIATYVGEIEDERQNRAGLKALLVRIPPPPPRDERLRIWELRGAPEFFCPLQVWVDIGLNGYRPAYRKLLPDRDITGLVLSHARDR